MIYFNHVPSIYNYIHHITILHDHFRIIPGYSPGGMAWPWSCGSLGTTGKPGLIMILNTAYNTL